ncbi:ABC transporter substrate-binding protein [Gardnerella sp. KA01002]
MESIVLELQNEIVSSNCDVVNILRKAHLIASKLKLNDFDQWIQHELNGYPDEGSCPEYRKVRGSLKAFNPYRGWIPTSIQDNEYEKRICEKKFVNSISEIISLCQSSGNVLISGFSGEQLASFDKMADSLPPMDYALHIPTTAVKDIEEKVKNTILEWTLKLESKGIVGENMVFSETEKESAVNMPQTVNNYYGNTSVINSPSDNVQIVSGSENTVTFSYDKVKDVVDAVEKSISESDLSKEDIETATELLADIKLKIEEEKKPHILKSALVGLKDFLINTGAGVTAGVIQAKIQGLF